METPYSITKQTGWLVAFSIAMGYLEATVVVYLRLHYYPNGFAFPLVPLDKAIGLVEIFREAATVVMLLGIAVLAGKNFNQRFAFFLLSFAVWDLFYYVFLKVILNWPESWFTWDILFLIPVPWVGPVISAVIVSITMILFSSVILIHEVKATSKKIIFVDWALVIVGSLVVIFSWIIDFVSYARRIADLPHSAMETLAAYVPQQFNWLLFGAGEMILIIAIIRYWKNHQPSH